MSSLNGIAGLITPSRASADGGSKQLRLTRDGAPITLPWYQALCMEGVVFQAEAHGATIFTGLTLLAHASYADTAKGIYVDIPDGLAAIPLEVFFNFLATGAAIVHYAAYCSATLNGVGGTETLITCVNMNLANTTDASGCTAAHTADSETDTVTGAEIFLDRHSTNQDLDGVGIIPKTRWMAAESAIAPLLRDGASINVNASPTTSGTGFGHINFAVMSESYFN